MSAETALSCDENALAYRNTTALASVALDIEALAARATTALSRHPPEQRSVLERVHGDRLLDHLEGRHEPAEVDAAVERFVEALRACLAGRSGAG